MTILGELAYAGTRVLLNVAPIIVIVFFFQFLVVRRRPPDLHNIVAGFCYVLVGLTTLVVGLEWALFPLGDTMARQLAGQSFMASEDGTLVWGRYVWVCAFAAAVGFAAALVEPTLTAVARRTEDLAGGTVGAMGLRLMVAIGVGLGAGIGAIRIVLGVPFLVVLGAGLAVLLVQIVTAPRMLMAVAVDVGGVAVSTVTVPVLAAVGLGIASTVPGRDPLTDGFGVIAFAAFLPIMTVLAYVQIGAWRQSRRRAL